MSHPVGTLGFRPPQFSEDLAWLPDWLQQHQKEQFYQCTKETKHSNLELASKDFKFFEGNTNEECRYSSCHLFLSGEDNSEIGFGSSPENVLHFHLHLSSNGSLQCSASSNFPAKSLDASQNHLESSIVVSKQLIHSSVVSKVKTCSVMGLNVDGINSIPLNSSKKPHEDVSPKCPTSNKISANHFGQKLNAADIIDAVELSIAASEALVIHEIMRSGLTSEVLPTAPVLEAALWIKKARLEWLEDASDSLSEETDMSDSLSDLDDFTMSDAYEDVGLSQSIPSDECASDSHISQVKETPASENQYDCVNLSDSLELRAQHVKFDDISAQKELGENLLMEIRSGEELHQESVDCEMEEVYDKPVRTQKICTVGIRDPSALKNSDSVIVKQTVGQSMVDITSCQLQNKVNFRPHDWSSGIAREEDTGTHSASERFQSRWLGGWTGQDVSASTELKQNTKAILNCFAAETSFLSESADIAPDLNSFVQVDEPKSYRTSDSSIHFAGLHETNKGILLSQDAARSCSLSSIDPLCSVVPCSISSENSIRTLAQNQKGKENDAEEFQTPELGVDNLHKSSNLVIKFHNEDGQAMPTINGEYSPVTVRRQLVSLRTYSTLLPNHVSMFAGRSLYHNQPFELECDQRLIPFNQNVGCISSDKRSCKESFPSKPVSLHTDGRYNEKIGETISNQNSVATMKNQKRNYHEIAGDGNELPVQASKKRRQPLIFNHRARLRLQASKPFLNNSTWQKPLKQASTNVLKLQQNKELENIQSRCINFHCRDFAVKKRVCFTETEIPDQQTKTLQKLDSSTENCSTVRPSKRWKYSEFQSNEKSCLTNCHLKSGRRSLFEGIEFLLTGFSRQKEKDIERIIWEHGGIVLSDIPSPNSRAILRSKGNQLPIILSLKKLRTTKFLFGCAVNAFILKVDWLTNSISAGCVVPPEKYLILPNRAVEHISFEKPFHHKPYYVFERVGIMLHGKHSFYSKLAKIVKHGGGKVFKTLQWLVHSLDKRKVSLGAIVAEDGSGASRHLRHCASEQKIPIMPASWIIKSLHLGKLLPFPDKGHFSFPASKIPEILVSTKMTEDV